MQSYDERDRIVQSKMLEKSALGGQDLQDLNARIKQRISEVDARALPSQVRQAAQIAESKGAVRHVIANMPNNGQEVEIGGLRFKVSYVNNRRGDVHLKLMGVVESPEASEEREEETDEQRN